MKYLRENCKSWVKGTSSHINAISQSQAPIRHYHKAGRLNSADIDGCMLG